MTRQEMILLLTYVDKTMRLTRAEANEISALLKNDEKIIKGYISRDAGIIHGESSPYISKD